MTAVLELKNIYISGILSMPEWTVEEGSVVCLTGESGSGKTTLLRLMNNLRTPERGDVVYRGESVQSKDPLTLRQRIVMSAQTPVVFPGTLKENVRRGADIAGRDVTDSEIQDVLRRCRLEKPLEEEASTLSGGEKQRMALARVLLMDPDVLLLDEPTSALDEETGKKVLEAVLAVCREKGKTVIIVTHDRSLAENWADTVVEMNEIAAKEGAAHE
ncbi:ABC transporter ATP-binding protein [Alkalicoccus urumqiensis]|uniref:ABC transporter ATP-binding protein n=1 Tax=Alkalicoccus urumqiensis TaxID=1548213 RepID=A0A2P6MIQ5_ALKUR|nr:ABC transporter ATP-binding protein [Alkalicoccus urumqiensis]PRO66174.1 ABC transporter ATP-binding protein [Alkalicoccus urumqiensis]